MLPQDSALLSALIEQQRMYHVEKIKLLEEELSRLTILEHPLQIRRICSDIIKIKKSLEEITSPGEGR